MSITLLLLAMHQDVQEKVVEELKQIFPDKHSEVTKEDVEKMKYLEMCIQEELRMFPSVPIFGKRVDRYWKLRNYTIPKNTSIVIDVYHLHRHPKYWQNANVFNPENFSDENIAKIKPFTYLPFGGGPRHCIGILIN